MSSIFNSSVVVTRGPHAVSSIFPLTYTKQSAGNGREILSQMSTFQLKSVTGGGGEVLKVIFVKYS